MNSSHTLIFTDSISKDICTYEFNRFIKNSKATMFNFPGTSSHQMLHYLDVQLKDRQINTVAVHVGINDILRDSSQSSTDGLLQNKKHVFKMPQIWCEKHPYFGVSLYKQDKHWYFLDYNFLNKYTHHPFAKK